MCTVSFVNSGSKIIITSNRDEQVSRPALPPDWYTVNNKNLLFPKDPRAGGTWFASDVTGNTAVLLNGAEHTHEIIPNAKYTRSRGLILLDILSHDEPLQKWQQINLYNIEPFTLILYTQTYLYQLRWDGLLKNSILLNSNQNYIWSSATLYTKEVIVKREKLFSDFLKSGKLPVEDDLLNFHTDKVQPGSNANLVINRDILKTLSVTQNIIDGNTAEMRYYDLSDLKEYILKSAH